MKQRLSAVLMALNGGDEENRKGIASLAREPAQQAFLGDLQKNIEGMVKSLTTSSREGDDLEAPVDELQEQARSVAEEEAEVRERSRRGQVRRDSARRRTQQPVPRQEL